MELENKDLEYATEVRKARRKTGLKTQEFFTPESLVKKMCDKVPEEDWADITKTFLEPSFGNGNFLVEMIQRRISHGVDWRTTLSTLYGVELMEDNVQETKQRILNLLHDICGDIDDVEAREIMDKNLVCSDFFKWNFEEWRPMTEEEYKQSQKKKK